MAVPLSASVMMPEMVALSGGSVVGVGPVMAATDSLYESMSVLFS